MPRDQVPEQINPKTLGDYLEVMSKVVFQTGMSWRVVESKWDAIREAFHEFDSDAVANLTEPELDALTTDKRVFRNRRKILAVVENAPRMIELDESYGSFRNYLRSHNGFEETVKDLRKQFKFLGEMGCHYFLYVVGEEVPSHSE